MSVLLALGACQVQERTARGTVLSVQEAKQALPEDLLKFDDGNLRLPEVAWQVEVQLDDGSQVRTPCTPAGGATPLGSGSES